VSLADKLLSKPVGPSTTARPANPEKDFTKSVEVTGDTASVEVRVPASEADAYGDVTARSYLAEEGLDPAEWMVDGFRVSEWTMANGSLGVSKRFSLRRKSASATEAERPPLDEILSVIKAQQPKARRADGDHGYIVALGDMQFGKIDGDGVEGTLRRTLHCIDAAADQLAWYRKRFDIGHIHVAWLGDHIEGFVSQGGANVWRTPLTLNEQVRLTRRVMTHALVVFAPLAVNLTMTAVPGNHGEPQRFSGKGITRYDDSHDTESLIAVSEAAAMAPETFGHVKFYVPDTDEMSVTLDVAGTTVAHAHGHQWRPGKHFDWWRGQAFHSPGLHQAELLLAGHLHHEFVDTDGPRKFVQVPSMESESTWFKHSTGTTGDPGLIVAVTKDGVTGQMEVVR
jgi:hypothetical protein